MTGTNARAPRDRFEVAVAVLVVSTTLVAACVGLLLAQASNRVDEAASNAGRAALAANESGAAADQRVDDALTLYQRRREYLARARSSREDLEIGDRRGAAVEAERWRRLAAGAERSLQRSLGGSLDIGDDGALGPERDELFPAGFRAMAHEPVHLALAQRDAANGKGAEWGRRTASYAAVLTLLAVALYLYGFALTPEGRELRGLFAAVATAFLCLGVIFGPVRAASSPDRPDDRAAAEFARAAAVMRAAAEPDEFVVAERHLTRAIAARPDFVEAYMLRANARFAGGAPEDVFSGSLTTPEALQGALEDVRMARSLGLRTSSAMRSEGFFLFLLAIRADRHQLLPEAVAVTRAAVKLRPRDFIARLNLAVILLASGRVDDARREYRSTLDALAQRPDWQRNAVGSGAISDLELVAEHGSIDLVDDVRAMKELIVGALAGDKLGTKAPAVAFEAVVQPGRALIRTTGAEPWNDGTVSVLWYHEEPRQLGWSHVSELLVADAMSWDGETIAAPYVRGARRCLPRGRYRAELYLDGRLLGSATTRYGGRAAAVVDRERDLLGCRPTAWEEQPAESPLVSSYASADRRSGLHLVRLDRTYLLDPERAIEHALDKLVGTPRGPRRPLMPDFSDLGMFSSAEVYAYRGGRLHAAAVGAWRGSTVVAVVYGPRRALARAGMTPRDILASLDTADL